MWLAESCSVEACVLEDKVVLFRSAKFRLREDYAFIHCLRNFFLLINRTATSFRFESKILAHVSLFLLIALVSMSFVPFDLVHFLMSYLCSMDDDTLRSVQCI